MVITQYIESELETSTSEENDGSIQYDAQETKEYGPADTKNSSEVVYEEIESMDLCTVDTNLDERSEKQDPVEVSIVDMEAVDGRQESLTQEEKGMVTNQKEATDLISLCMIKQPFVKLERLDLSGRQCCKTFNPGAPKRGQGRQKKDPQNKTMCRKKREEKKVMVPTASINKYGIIIITLHFLKKKHTFSGDLFFFTYSVQAYRIQKWHFQHCSKVKEDM